jgi:hypothetical protein
MNEKLMVACVVVFSVVFVYNLAKKPRGYKPIDRLLYPPVWWCKSQPEWWYFSMHAESN